MSTEAAQEQVSTAPPCGSMTQEQRWIDSLPHTYQELGVARDPPLNLLCLSISPILRLEQHTFTHFPSHAVRLTTTMSTSACQDVNVIHCITGSHQKERLVDLRGDNEIPFSENSWCPVVCFFLYCFIEV